MRQHKRAVGRFRTRNNRPPTLGESTSDRTERASRQRRRFGEHQRSYHRQLCLRTRSPLPSSSPPKRTSRVTRPDTATLTPTRRRFQQLRKTKAQDEPDLDPDLDPRYSWNNPADQPNSSMPYRPSGPQHAYPSERRNTGRPLIRTRS